MRPMSTRTSSPERKKRRASASLIQLDATLFLDALMDAMESGKRPHVEAALRAIESTHRRRHDAGVRLDR